MDDGIAAEARDPIARLPVELVSKVAHVVLASDTRSAACLCAACKAFHSALHPLLLPVREQRQRVLLRPKGLLESVTAKFDRYLGLNVNFLEGVDFGYDPEVDESRR